MMLTFHKYHGAGNDFIVIDNRQGIFDARDVQKVKYLCHRRFGVGADGVLLLGETSSQDHDFEMVYLNSDGSRGAMCGNGGRCIVHFAHHILGIIPRPESVRFLAPDGEHEAAILTNGRIKLKMQDMGNIERHENSNLVNCGTTPHHIEYVSGLENFPVVETGRKVRYSYSQGANASFVEIKDGIFNVRIYERGVEDETLACGTAATSVAVVSHSLGLLKESICHTKWPGGELVVEFTPPKNPSGTYTNIWLTGEAVCVFEGKKVSI